MYGIREYDFVLTGITPLLSHQDSVELSDDLTAWRKAPENKNLSTPGDDRSPPWTWKTYLYTDGSVVGIPADNLMVSLRDAGASLVIKGNKTYKSVTQSGLLVPDIHLPLEVNGRIITVDEIEAVTGPFKNQLDYVREKLGFSLFCKRAKVGQTKHVRVRPRFDKWVVRGTIQVSVDEITEEILRKLFDLAGRYKGLCDWRPSSKQSPGSWGRFTASLTAKSE